MFCNTFEKSLGTETAYLQDETPAMGRAILQLVKEQIPEVTGIALCYPQVRDWDDWWIPEGNVPEARYHDVAANHLYELLTSWAERAERDVVVARNLAIRYMEDRPRIGIDPDLCVLDPVPPEEATCLVRSE